MSQRYADFVWVFHDRVEIGPKMLTRIAKHTAIDGGGFVMPPDRLSTSHWKRALGFLRIVWMEFSRPRVIVGESSPAPLAAAAAPAARAVFVRLWTITTLTIAATMVEAVTVERAHPPRP